MRRPLEVWACAIALGAIGGGGCGGATRIATTGEGGGASGSDADSGAGGRGFDAGSDLNRNRVPASEACRRAAEIQCAAEALCCPRPAPPDACIQLRQTGCNGNTILRDIFIHPSLGYDIDRAEAAFEEYEKRSSACDLTLRNWAISDQGFRGVARGTIPAGGDCTPPDPTVNPSGLGVLFGGCMDPEKMACFGASVWHCEPRVGVGEPCTFDTNCFDNLHCGSENALVCVQRKPDGARCGTLLDCQSLHCQNSVCVSATLENTYCGDSY